MGFAPWLIGGAALGPQSTKQSSTLTHLLPACHAADEVRAAASAALKALPAGRSTVFFVETSEESGAADEGEHVGPAGGTAGSVQHACTPAAALCVAACPYPTCGTAVVVLQDQIRPATVQSARQQQQAGVTRRHPPPPLLPTPWLAC